MMSVSLTTAFVHFTAKVSAARNVEDALRLRNSNSERRMTNFEDFAFNAQSAASSLASTSLQDPSNLVSSIPVIYGAGLLTSVSVSILSSFV
jgi:hypothetical protein